MNVHTSPNRKTESALRHRTEQEAMASLFRRSMFWTPARQAPSSWIEHVPFAFWLVDVLRPHRIVELGTHNGVSYSAMCQAVKTLELATSCFAIDTWQGDAHAGFYEEGVYQDFAAFNHQRYGTFSRLVRSTFDDALHHFEDGSIDLLHIDGLHTYETVQHDYQSWVPKLSANAVVLFHDTNVREREFGVFRLWDEITAGKLHFSFLHGHGLGVLGEGSDYPDALRLLFNSRDERLVSTIRETFKALGQAVRISSERTGLDATHLRIDELERTTSDRTGEIDRLQHAVLDCTGEIRETPRELSEHAREVSGLRDALSEHTSEISTLQQMLAERTRDAVMLQQSLASSEAQVGALGATISALNASTSWRITAPLRGISKSARWLWRNVPRMSEFVSKACTRYLGLAILGLLPYYRRYIPEHIRRYVSAHLPAKLKRPSVIDQTKVAAGYNDWIRENDRLSDDDRNLIRAHIASFGRKPKLSILMPVYNTPPQYLRESIDSIVRQLYPEWELCIADDASASADVRPILCASAARDNRIKVRFRDVNGGISACSNTALEMATGDWIVLMDHDDTLAEHALYLLADAINRDADLAIIYSDEDHIDQKGRRSSPYFKPDWDYDLCLGQNLINHLGAYRVDLAREIGGFREGVDGSQDWDFALRILEKSSGAGVHHIPFILYHWRQTPQTFSNTSLTRAVDAACRTVSDHLRRIAQDAEVTPLGQSSFLKIKRTLPAERPLVSIIIPTKDHHELMQRCIHGLVNRTDYTPVEIVIVDNGSSEPDACEFLRRARSRPRFVVVEDNGPFNFSRLVNRGVAASSGEICVLLNNDVDVINADWLDELVAHALRPEVGAVGAKLYYPDDTLQHGGVILGIGGVAAHQHRFSQREAYGYFGRLKLAHGLSCVTAACLAVRRAIHDEVGGFDEEHLAVAFNDVDFCIRIREAGYRIIWTPHAELYHYESRSRGHDTTPEKARRFATEATYMRTRWGKILDNDPFYNPNLSLNSDFFEVAAKSRAQKPWLAHARPASFSPTAVARSHEHRDDAIRTGTSLRDTVKAIAGQIPIVSALIQRRAMPLEQNAAAAPTRDDPHDSALKRCVAAVRGAVSPPASRADQLLAPIDRSARVIEIGPSFSPIAPKADGWNAITVDHASRFELVQKYAGHPGVDVNRIEEVDFVWMAGPLANAVPPHLHGTFDAFIASHVIEHATDLIGFLDAAETLLSSSGVVILAIPDKRFCFDFFRPMTTTGEVLSADASRRNRHTRRIVFDHIAYVVKNGGTGAWGPGPVGEMKFIHTLEEAGHAFASASEDPSDPYVDAHAWQFTPASFELLLLELARLEKTDWQVQQVTPVAGCEFHAWLRRGGKALASALSQSALDAQRLALLKQSLLQMREQIDFLLAADAPRPESSRSS